MSPARRRPIARRNALRAGVTLLGPALWLPASAEHAEIAPMTVWARGGASGLSVPSLEQASAELGRVAGGAAVIDAESYSLGRVGNLSDALGFAAGVFIQPRFGAEESRLSIRGSGLQRTFHLRGIQLLQDGVPLSLADGGGDFQALDPLNAQYIEVLRGPNALQYGATTLGGAINVVLPTGLSAPGTRLRAEYGSFDYQRLLVSHGGQQGAADYFLAATYAGQSGYREHAGQASGRLSANAGLRLTPELESRFYLQFADTDSELPGNLTRAQMRADPRQANATSLANRHQRDYFLWRLSNRTVWAREGLRLEAGLYYSAKDLFHPIFQVLDQTSRDWGGTLRLTWDGTVLGRRNVLTAGFTPQWGETEDDRFANVAGQRGARTAGSDQRAVNHALFFENQHFALHYLALVTGLQATRSERRYRDRFLADGDASFDVAYEQLSPKLGLRWEFDARTQVFANFSRSFEPPSFGELTGANVVNVLDAQRASSFELGSRGESTRLGTRWDLVWYRAWLDKEMLGLTQAPFTVLTVSAGETLREGLELGLETRFRERLSLRQNYLWTRARFDGDPVFGYNAIAGVPEHFYRAELLHHWPQGYYLGPTVEWMPTKAAVDHANTLFADPYVLLGLRAGYRSVRGFAWFLDARNLTDQTYAASTGVTRDARGLDDPRNPLFLPGDGVSVFGGVEWQF